MFYRLSPIVPLALFWLALSGYYTALLLSLGVVSCIGVQLISKRMDIVNHEGHPIHLQPWRIVTYWVWLIKEIVLSTWSVSRMILAPKLTISPKVVRLPAHGMSDLQKVTYANSITLTPGTLTLDISQSELEIHSLRGKMLEPLERGEMADRVRKLSPGKKPKTK